MRTINKRIIMVVIVGVIFLTFTIVLMFSMFSNAEEYSLKHVNSHLYESNVLVNAGNIVDKNGVVLAETVDSERVYNDNADIRTAFLHTIGDNKGFIAGGVQNSFKYELSGYDVLYGVNKSSETTLHLTLDAQLCAYAYRQIQPYKGCVAVCDYKTGELICVATSPSYDIYNKPSDIDTNDNYEGIYINRFFGGLYTPGSVFKIVTAMSAIENTDGIINRTFTCNGSYKTDSGTVVCNDIHGDLTFEQALNRSCNSAFAQIANELGADKLNEAFASAGLDNNYETIDRLVTSSGRFSLSADSSQSDVGWAGIGQHTTLVNPYSVLTFICAIANGGTCNQPYFVKSATNENGRTDYSAKPENSGININLSTASLLKKMMRSTVSDYYGDYIFGELTMCGKTGTAESDDKLSTAWFVGFSDNEEFPYAVVAVLEESGSGLRYAGSLASDVLQELYNKTF